MFTSSTAIEPRLRKNTTRMASPIAASAAATVSTNKAKTCPTRSPSAAEKATKLMLTESRISSIDIRMTMTFLRFRKIPNTPRVNRIADTVRKCAMPMVISDALPRLDLLDLDGGGRRARHLLRDGLPLDVRLVAQGKHDGPDHRHKQDQPGNLEEIKIVRVDDVAERGGVGSLRQIGDRLRHRGSELGCKAVAAHHHDQ